MRLIGTWRKRFTPFVDRFFYFIAKKIGDSIRLEAPGWDRYENSDQPIIFCSWHGRSFLGTILFRNRGYWIIVSNSRDGEMQSKIFRRFGFRTIRGSTGKEGVRAAIETIRVLKTGAKVALTPDGPRGPSHKLQDGVLLMAQKSGALIVPVGASARRRWFFNSWDKFMLPKPFTKAVLVFGDPIGIPADSTPDSLNVIRSQIEAALDEAEVEAERRMGHA